MTSACCIFRTTGSEPGENRCQSNEGYQRLMFQVLGFNGLKACPWPHGRSHQECHCWLLSRSTLTKAFNAPETDSLLWDLGRLVTEPGSALSTESGESGMVGVAQSAQSAQSAQEEWHLPSFAS